MICYVPSLHRPHMLIYLNLLHGVWRRKAHICKQTYSCCQVSRCVLKEIGVSSRRTSPIYHVGARQHSNHSSGRHMQRARPLPQHINSKGQKRARNCDACPSLGLKMQSLVLCCFWCLFSYWSCLSVVITIVADVVAVVCHRRCCNHCHWFGADRYLLSLLMSMAEDRTITNTVDWCCCGQLPVAAVVASLGRGCWLFHC